MSPWKKTFYAAWIGQVFSITGFSFVIPFMPFYIQGLHPAMSQAEIARWAGIATAATGVTMAIFAPIWGHFADRWGRKPMVLRSMFCGAGVLLLMAFSRNVTELIVLRLLQGILTGTITANIALVSSVTPANRSGYTLGMMQAAVFFGTSAGPFIGGEVADRFGFQAAFLVAAGLLLLGGFLVSAFASEKFEAPPVPNEGHIKSFVGMFGVVGFIAALIALFQVHFAGSALAPVLPLFIKQLLGSDEGATALTGRIIGLTGLAAALAAGVFGRFSDAWGHKRVLIISTLLAGLITLPVALATSIPQIYVLRILFGLAAAGIMPSANAIIRRVMQEQHLGKAYGITASISSFGWGLGPLLGGYMAAAGLRLPFLSTGALLILAAGYVAWKVKPVPRRGELAIAEPEPE
jgi:MFS transporter, DHA1 family, multidrug resistance protein